MTLYLTTALKNPGIVLNNYVTELKEADELKEEKRICMKCNVFKPANAHHCDDCGVCVREHDHHCPWTGKCIGEGNLYSFYGFVISIFVLIVSLGVL